MLIFKTSHVRTNFHLRGGLFFAVLLLPSWGFEWFPFLLIVVGSSSLLLSTMLCGNFKQTVVVSTFQLPHFSDWSMAYTNSNLLYFYSYCHYGEFDKSEFLVSSGLSRSWDMIPKIHYSWMQSLIKEPDINTHRVSVQWTIQNCEHILWAIPQVSVLSGTPYAYWPSNHPWFCGNLRCPLDIKANAWSLPTANTVW